jgi:hypothetical protein
MRFVALAVLAVAVSACAASPGAVSSRGIGAAPASRSVGAIAPGVGAAGLRAGWARVVAPGAVPAAIAALAHGRAQAASDAASERRDIDFFALPSNPLGIAIGSGADAAWVLGFLGTGKTDADVNVELRALVAGGDVGVTMNYSGPTTLGRAAIAAPAPSIAAARGEGRRFELVTGVPGNGVADAYVDYMGGLERQLERRWDARPFAFDDVPVVFAVSRSDVLEGFVFTNQGNRLILGERKYADVQSVAAFTAEGELAAAYTAVGFNRKTSGPGAAPVWQLERDARFGTIAVCGEI